MSLVIMMHIVTQVVRICYFYVGSGECSFLSKYFLIAKSELSNPNKTAAFTELKIKRVVKNLKERVQQLFSSTSSQSNDESQDEDETGGRCSSG